ncbi:MAG: hypothetical protein ABW217_22600 [Polyangiaceae bacterium]
MTLNEFGWFCFGYAACLFVEVLRWARGERAAQASLYRMKQGVRKTVSWEPDE